MSCQSRSSVAAWHGTTFTTFQMVNSFPLFPFVSPSFSFRHSSKNKTHSNISTDQHFKDRLSYGFSFLTQKVGIRHPPPAAISATNSARIIGVWLGVWSISAENEIQRKWATSWNHHAANQLFGCSILMCICFTLQSVALCCSVHFRCKGLYLLKGELSWILFPLKGIIMYLFKSKPLPYGAPTVWLQSIRARNWHMYIFKCFVYASFQTDAQYSMTWMLQNKTTCSSPRSQGSSDFLKLS